MGLNVLLQCLLTGAIKIHCVCSFFHSGLLWLLQWRGSVQLALWSMSSTDQNLWEKQQILWKAWRSPPITSFQFITSLCPGCTFWTVIYSFINWVSVNFWSVWKMFTLNIYYEFILYLLYIIYSLWSLLQVNIYLVLKKGYVLAKVVTHIALLRCRIMMRTEEHVPVWTTALVISTTLWLDLVLKWLQPVNAG